MQVGETALSQLQHRSLGTCLALAVGVVWALMTPILKGVKLVAFGEQWRVEEEEEEEGA